MTLHRSLEATLGVAFFSLSLIASTATAGPDAVAGKAKSQICSACHGEAGIAVVPGVPHLAAQPYLSVFYQLVQFREQRRLGGGMEALVATLSDQDMRDIGAHYASLPAPPAGQALAEKITAGAQISRQSFCQSCHGENLQGQKHVPRIAGQSADYLTLQLKNLRSGARADMDGTMGSAARALSDADIDALAAFASAKP